MRRLLLFVIITVFTLPLRAETLQLLYTGNLDGELEPCGCTLDTDYGGISRRATFIDEQRQQRPDLILISSGGLFSPEMGSDQIKHRFILSGLEQLDYDAVGVQWADLTHGVDFITKSSLPFSASNWKGTALNRSVQIRRGQHRLRYLQWLDPATSPYAAMPALNPISDDVSELTQQLQKARDAGELTILATTLELGAAQAQLPLALVDILLIKSAYEEFGEPQQLERGTLILQPGSRGQRIGTLKLSLDSNGRIHQWQHRVDALPNTVPDAPRLAAWYQAYNDALREDYQQRIKQRQQMDAGLSPYLGADQCQACHAAQYQSWQQTDHAGALESLELVGKAFDSHCVGCHVVGFTEPGGYLDITLTDHLAGVQCENCHGAGREHASSGGQKPTLNRDTDKPVICGQCHVKEHSPSFTVDDYWPRIAHPIMRPTQ